MSGWVKVEKDLERDPRVLRMAKALDRNFWFFEPNKASQDGSFDPSNAHALPAVTLVVGALARLWVYADSHAREDDSLDLSTDEIDELLGIPGFCSLIPDCWLRVLDAQRVELPNFHEHNGVEAKKKDLNAKRQQRHRDKGKRISVTAHNGTALPDQTKTKTSKESPHTPDFLGADGPSSKTASPRNGKAVPLPDDFTLSETMRAQALAKFQDCDVTEMFDQFRAHHQAHGKVMKSWPAAWTTWLGNATRFGYPKSGDADNGMETLRG